MQRLLFANTTLSIVREHNRILKYEKLVKTVLILLELFFCSFIGNRRMTIIRKRHQGYEQKEEPSEEGLGFKEVDIEALLGNHALS